MPPQAPLILSTGAVARYPLNRKFQFSTRKVVFADFSRQTAAQLANPLGSWVLNLNLMQDAEANDWLDFWKSQQAGATPFSFTDPADNLLTYSEAQEQSSVWTMQGGAFVGKNYCLQSQPLSQSPWTPQNVGSSNPVVTDNASTAPDGTTTASSIAFPSVPNTGGDYSQLFQVTSEPPAYQFMTFTFSVWLRVTLGTANVSIEIGDNSSISNTTACALTGIWQRFSVSLGFGSSPNHSVAVAITNALNSPSATVFAWGAQIEYGSTPSDYTGTTSTSQILQIADPFFVQAPTNFPGFQWNLSSLLPRRGRQIVVTTVNGKLFQSIPVNPGGNGNSRTKGLSFTSSAWFLQQGTSATLQLQVQDLVTQAFVLHLTPSSTWTRQSVSGAFSPSNSSPQVSFVLTGFAGVGTFYMFGAQLETESTASQYKKTEAYSGFHPNCYFATDEFDHQQTEFNVGNIQQLTIEESN